MNAEIIIVGARGMGQELAGYLQSEGVRIKGFLDSGFTPETWQGPYPLLGSPETWMPSPEERFFVALGSAQWRRFYADLLRGRGARFGTFISRFAYIGVNVSIGEGSIIAPMAVLTANISVGTFCIVNACATISHDSIIRDFVTITSGVRIPGRCVLESDVFLGVNATLIPDIRLADGTIVGAGAVVTRSVFTAHETVAGVPARIMTKT